ITAWYISGARCHAMKIQLNYDRPSQVQTDLLVVISDAQTGLFNLGGSAVDETVRRVVQDINDKKVKKEYFTALDSKSPVRNVVVFWTALNPSYNAWENVKTFIARSLRMALDLGLQRVSVLLNTDAAVPFIGKAIEGAILGTYTFDKYRKDKTDVSKLQFEIVALKAHDANNRHYLTRYTIVSEAANKARDMINEPGSVVVPEYMA